MEIFGINLWVFVIGIPVTAFFGWILWKMAMQGDQWGDPIKQWSADVDPEKGERIRNLGPGGMDR